MSFPDIPENHWRSERPYIVTLIDGDRFPAYPILGDIDDEEIVTFGQHCQEKMWMVVDPMIMNPLINHYGNIRILKVSDVTHWEPIQVNKEIVKEKTDRKKHSDQEISP